VSLGKRSRQAVPQPQRLCSRLRSLPTREVSTCGRVAYTDRTKKNRPNQKIDCSQMLMRDKAAAVMLGKGSKLVVDLSACEEELRNSGIIYVPACAEPRRLTCIFSRLELQLRVSTARRRLRPCPFGTSQLAHNDQGFALWPELKI